jgi:SAM-dependent methyltransferase
MDRRLFAHIRARASVTEERRGGAERRRQLLTGLSGRVVEVGAGSGVPFAYYPATVRELVAVGPERILREPALEAAERAPVPVEVVDGLAERLPLPTRRSTQLAGVLWSVPDASRAQHEAARVLRPNGELRFYEHVVARNRRLARMQRLLDATFWPRLFGGCHTSRDTEATLVASGFTLETRERWSFRPTLLATPVAPRILGRARRGAAQPGT